MAAIVLEVPDSMTLSEYGEYLEILVKSVRVEDAMNMYKYWDFRKSINDAYYFNCGIVIKKIIEED